MRANGTLKVDYRPETRSAQNLRVMVHSYVLLATGDRNLSNRLTVACAELAENAARLNPNATFTLEILLEDQQARALLSNEASPRDHLEMCVALEEANRGRSIDSYSRALSQAGSGLPSFLSLARTRYEGQLALSLHRQGSRLTVIAQTHSAELTSAELAAI